MARLPVPGSDNDTWGTVLNDFLNVSHNADGTLKSAALATANGVTSATVSSIIALTQAEYDALSSKDSSTLYVITA